MKIGTMKVWHPIESAPMDGQRILLWWSPCPYPCVGFYDVDGGREGWRCDGDECIPRNQTGCTHWMPMPEPPDRET